jgi:two-component system sensor histidine kinase ChiS
MTPSEAFEWLNRCYGAVGPEVRRFGGFIDKYIGDAVMALFPRSPVDALRAAIAMHAKLERLGGVRMGTGIHLGSTMLGTLGEAERFEATVLSDAVNVASRMEGVSKHFGARVVVTGALREAAQYEEFRWRALGRVRLKGRDAAVEIFELLDADSERERADKLEFIAEFQEGVDAFQVGRFRDALLRFERIVAEVPEDGAALAYRSYAANAVESPSDDFDGTVALTSK